MPRAIRCAGPKSCRGCPVWFRHVTAPQSVSGGGGVLAVPGAPLARFIVPDRLLPSPRSLAGLIGLRTDGYHVTGLMIEGG